VGGRACGTIVCRAAGLGEAVGGLQSTWVASVTPTCGDGEEGAADIIFVKGGKFTRKPSGNMESIALGSAFYAWRPAGGW
jgi:hypothetical protein